MTPAKVQFQPAKPTEADWQVEGLAVHDRFGEPYRMRLALRTDDLSAEPTQLLGTSASVVIERASLHQELGGIVERVEEGEHDGMGLHAVLTIVPALVALSYRRNSRIFQEQTIPQILEAVLGNGLGAYGRSVDLSGLVADYPAQEYTVQYRETDFDFVHRLMEENGIAYRFATDGGVETLVLWDGDTAFGEIRSTGNAAGVLPVRAVGGDPGLREDVQQLERDSALRPTVARTAVFDWHVPTPLQDGEDPAAASLSSPNGAALGPEREDYDHAEPSVLYGHRSAALDFSHVERQLELRRAVHQRDAVRCRGTSTATQLTPGLSFELLDHPQAELSGNYVVVGVEHLIGIYAGEAADSAYFNRFECLPAAVPWRPDRRRARPRIPGIQTATVVGPGGEEIHTDAHGRIKVQFHWDRDGHFGADASCFVRVVQPWAGNGWGALFLPRIGMEVAVTFVDGDPDRPIVTGCLYNGAHAPPYGLPGDKTKSTIKSNSSPGGGGFNELRFEDAAGSEEIFMHAQKDLNDVVGNNHGVTVGNDETISIGNNQTIDVAVDQTQTIGSNQVEDIGANQTLTVGANQDATVKANQTLEVLGNQTSTVNGAADHTVNAGMTSLINAGFTSTVNAGATCTVSGGLTLTVNGATTLAHHGSINQTVDGAYNLTTTGGYNLVAPAGVTITALGGLTIVDPAATTEVHGFWDSTKRMSKTATGFSLSLTGGSVSATGMSVGVTGVGLSATGLSVSANGLSASYTGLDMRKDGAKLWLGALHLSVAAFHLFG